MTSKRIKNIVFVLILMAVIPFLFACSSKTELAIPKTNLNKDSEIVSWNNISGADYYVVDINGKEYQTTLNYFELDTYCENSGIYNIKVKACSQDTAKINSKFSASQVLDKKEDSSIPRISFDTASGNLYWTEISGATFYKLTINNVDLITDKTSFNLYAGELDEYLIRDNYNKFSVSCPATSDYYASGTSREMKLYVAKLQQAPTNLSVELSEGQHILKFDNVFTASSYTIFVNDKSLEVSTNIVDISMLINGSGQYKIAVKANQVNDGSGKTSYMPSANSEIYIYNVN